MRKVIIFLLTGFVLFYSGLKVFSMSNPWIDCNSDLYCAAQMAGFNFPLRVQNYTVRAMEDMIEITFPLEKKRTVTVRKSLLYPEKPMKTE